MLNTLVDNLINVSDESWEEYAFRREPLIRKISRSRQQELTALAKKSGVKLAEDVRNNYPDQSIEEIILQLGIQLETTSSLTVGAYTVFAVYEEPNKIMIATDQITTLEEMLDKEAKDLLGNVSIKEIVLAHELYHYFEYRIPDFPTSQKLLKVWNIGTFSGMKRVKTVGELGAMAFTKEILGINYSPYLLDILLLYPETSQRKYALMIYNEIMEIYNVSKQSM